MKHSLSDWLGPIIIVSLLAVCGIGSYFMGYGAGKKSFEKSQEHCKFDFDPVHIRKLMNEIEEQSNDDTIVITLSRMPMPLTGTYATWFSVRGEKTNPDGTVTTFLPAGMGRKRAEIPQE